MLLLSFTSCVAYIYWLATLQKNTQITTNHTMASNTASMSITTNNAIVSAVTRFDSMNKTYIFENANDTNYRKELSNIAKLDEFNTTAENEENKRNNKLPSSRLRYGRSVEGLQCRMKSKSARILYEGEVQCLSRRRYMAKKRRNREQHVNNIKTK